MFLILKRSCAWQEHDIPLVVDNTFGAGVVIYLKPLARMEANIVTSSAYQMDRWSWHIGVGIIV